MLNLFNIRSVRSISFLVSGLCLWGFPCTLTGQESQEDKQREVIREEAAEYYKQWLNQDVVYIVSGAEKSVFEKLSTDEEREQFIEQFWIRRDPDISTAANEFKEEHYRRLAYANERFKSGVPGWKTDRGRIYIIHGDPAEIESHKSGESYYRPSHEGGGLTATYPFEIWRYRYIEGIGNDVELEFVDKSGSGEFRLAVTPWEKDALLMIPGTGMTIAEELGLAQRKDHPYFSYASHHRYPGMHTRAKDDPFLRYETIAIAQRPKEIKYQDLKEIVDVNVTYNKLPFTTRQDFFQLSEKRVLSSLSIEVENRNLSFGLENGVHIARVAVYGLVTSLTGRVVTEFEDDLAVSFRPESLTAGLTSSSVYQKTLPLDTGMRYRLDLVVKDMKGEKLGVVRKGIIPPPFDSEKLRSSSLILSDQLSELKDAADQHEMFVLGDVKVRPSLSKSFSSTAPFWVYLQVYNANIDQSTLTPDLSVKYRIVRDGKAVIETLDDSGESVQFFSGQRIVVIKNLPLATLPKGKYKVEVSVEDRLGEESILIHESFEVRG
jgi:GWxTD domain-containing protein